MPYLYMPSPVGPLRIEEQAGAIASLSWSEPGESDQSELLEETGRQLRAYFYSDLQRFDLPLCPAGSAFQQQVYAQMLDIDYGYTRTYGEIAAKVDGSAQAVGQACGSNPIAIIIPCHRVLAAGGLGGYSGAHGVETKVSLLKLEGAYSLLI